MTVKLTTAFSHLGYLLYCANHMVRVYPPLNSTLPMNDCGLNARVWMFPFPLGHTVNWTESFMDPSLEW